MDHSTPSHNSSVPLHERETATIEQGKPASKGSLLGPLSQVKVSPGPMVR